MLNSIKDIPYIALVVLCAFMGNFLCPLEAYADDGLHLPSPGQILESSPNFSPVLLKGLTIDPKNPFAFDFIVDSGDSGLSVETQDFASLQDESKKLIKYFLASLTTPEDDLWVNLSPYEKNRIVPENFGQTQMGRDLLAQDYILKQLTASLIYPEKDLGKKFWEKVYKKAQAQYGTTQVPINTFNKVWIIPDKASVVEYKGTILIQERHLKVMLEEDYLAVEKHNSDKNGANSIGNEIIRQIILPEIEKEVNEGKNFANLRQIYSAMILATWFKVRLKESLLGKFYVNQNKIKGIDLGDKSAKQKIYDQYLETFKKGVYNYIKEDHDPITHQSIPRKYFSGGFEAGKNLAMLIKNNSRVVPSIDFASLSRADKASLNEVAENHQGNVSIVQARLEQPHPITKVKQIETAQVMGFLLSKWGIRQILKGGKIKHPDWFIVFKEDQEELRERMIAASTFGPLLDDRDVRDFREIAQQIVSGNINLPVVYKPHFGSLGRRIFYIHKGEGSDLIITFAYTDSTGVSPGTQRQVIGYFEGYGILPILDKDNQNIMQFVIDAANANAVDVLCGLWRLNSSVESRYDLGGMESYIDAFKLKGMSYESRFIFRGNFQTGQFIPTPNDPDQDASWIQDTRIGSSEFFSNNRGRPRSEALVGSNRYEAVLQKYDIDPSRWEEFQAYVYELIEHDFKLIVSRLNAVGIHLNMNVRGNFDLMWLPPEKRGEFPVPVLIETHFFFEPSENWEKYLSVDSNFDGKWQDAAMANREIHARFEVYNDNDSWFIKLPWGNKFNLAEGSFRRFLKEIGVDVLSYESNDVEKYFRLSYQGKERIIKYGINEPAEKVGLEFSRIISPALINLRFQQFAANGFDNITVKQWILLGYEALSPDFIELIDVDIMESMLKKILSMKEDPQRRGDVFYWAHQLYERVFALDIQNMLEESEFVNKEHNKKLLRIRQEVRRLYLGISIANEERFIKSLQNIESFQGIDRVISQWVADRQQDTVEQIIFNIRKIFLYHIFKRTSHDDMSHLLQVVESLKREINRDLYKLQDMNDMYALGFIHELLGRDLYGNKGDLSLQLYKNSLILTTEEREDLLKYRKRVFSSMSRLRANSELRKTIKQEKLDKKEDPPETSYDLEFDGKIDIFMNNNDLKVKVRSTGDIFDLQSDEFEAYLSKNGLYFSGEWKSNNELHWDLRLYGENESHLLTWKMNIDVKDLTNLFNNLLSESKPILVVKDFILHGWQGDEIKYAQRLTWAVEKLLRWQGKDQSEILAHLTLIDQVFTKIKMLGSNKRVLLKGRAIFWDEMKTIFTSPYYLGRTGEIVQEEEMPRNSVIEALKHSDRSVNLKIQKLKRKAFNEFNLVKLFQSGLSPDRLDQEFHEHLKEASPVDMLNILENWYVKQPLKGVDLVIEFIYYSRKAVVLSEILKEISSKEEVWDKFHNDYSRIMHVLLDNISHQIIRSNDIPTFEEAYERMHKDIEDFPDSIFANSYEYQQQMKSIVIRMEDLNTKFQTNKGFSSSEKTDQAMRESTVDQYREKLKEGEAISTRSPGGIDLNVKHLDLQIKRDDKGIPLPISQKPLESIHIEGFFPVIIKITPVDDLPAYLGFLSSK